MPPTIDALCNEQISFLRQTITKHVILLILYNLKIKVWCKAWSKKNIRSLCSRFTHFPMSCDRIVSGVYTGLLPLTKAFTLTLIQSCVLQLIPLHTRISPHLERLISSAEISGRALTDGFLSCTLYSRIFGSP